jgi:hypothetical protein|tara:strand:+ start:39 stop:395 length:357 start_codon:yes stop_codon:yes gene_type:complete
MGKRAIHLLARAIFVAHAFANNDHKILYFHKMPRGQYKPEGDDAVLLAKAILNNTVDRDPPSMHKWFETTDEGHRYATNQEWYKKDGPGQRNVRANVLKLYNKIECWKKFKDYKGKRK